MTRGQWIRLLDKPCRVADAPEVQAAVIFTRNNVAVFNLRILRFQSEEHNAARVVGNRLSGKRDMIHEAVFFQDEMVRWKDRHGSIGATFVQMHQRQEDSRSGFLVFGLHYYVFRSAARELVAHRPMAQMLFTHDGNDLPSWNKLFSALESMLE